MALVGGQLVCACSGRWQWLQKMVMLLGLDGLRLPGKRCSSASGCG